MARRRPGAGRRRPLPALGALAVLGALGALGVISGGAAGCGRGDDRGAARLYRDYCARCHGRDGAGMRRPDGFDPGLDLTASRMVAERRRADIHRRIAAGEGTMPGFAHRLTPEEIDRLVDFVVRFTLDREKASD
jgi:mono/diheme cytochrome c family protein